MIQHRSFDPVSILERTIFQPTVDCIGSATVITAVLVVLGLSSRSDALSKKLHRLQVGDE